MEKCSITGKTVYPEIGEMYKKWIRNQKICTLLLMIRGLFTVKLNKVPLCFPVKITNAAGVLMKDIVHIELFVT